MLICNASPCPFTTVLLHSFITPRSNICEGIFPGDTVVLRGRRRRETLIVAQPDADLDSDGKGDRMRVTRRVRRNLRCHLGRLPSRGWWLYSSVLHRLIFECLPCPTNKIICNEHEHQAVCRSSTPEQIFGVLCADFIVVFVHMLSPLRSRGA